MQKSIKDKICYTENHNATFIKNLKIEDYNLLIEINKFIK